MLAVALRAASTALLLLSLDTVGCQLSPYPPVAVVVGRSWTTTVFDTPFSLYYAVLLCVAWWG
jgi:hypothetical protein